MKVITLIKHFLRLDHFTPFFLIMFPNILLVCIYGYSGILLPNLFLLMISVLLILTGGCVWNDLIDLEYDKQCSRTKIRPMASGAIPKIASVTCIPLFIAFLFSTNWYYDSTHIFFYLALILTIIYPFAKRFTNMPQILLGAINFTPLITYIQITDNTKTIYTAISFYIMGAILIILYDTIYAWGDRADDKKLNIGNLGLLITEKYMPLFIDICWLLIWICFAIHLNFTSYWFWISFILFISMGMSQKSRFIKHKM